MSLNPYKCLALRFGFAEQLQCVHSLHHRFSDTLLVSETSCFSIPMVISSESQGTWPWPRTLESPRREAKLKYNLWARLSETDYE